MHDKKYLETPSVYQYIYTGLILTGTRLRYFFDIFTSRKAT